MSLCKRWGSKTASSGLYLSSALPSTTASISSINTQQYLSDDLPTLLLSTRYSLLSTYDNPVYILGDLNLDLLKYNESNIVKNYVDMLFSFGFLQLILKPTRCTPNSVCREGFLFLPCNN